MIKDEENRYNEANVLNANKLALLLADDMYEVRLL